MGVVKRSVLGAAIGAMPGGIVIASTLVLRGEIALTLGALGILLAAFGAIAGLIIGGTSPRRRDSG